VSVLSAIPLPIWALVIAAGAVVAMFGARPRTGSGERRCPDCWFDLGRPVRAVCIECGFAPSNREEFYPIRRSWRTIAAGLAVMLLGLVGHVNAGVADNGGKQVLWDERWTLRGAGVCAVALAVAMLWMWVLETGQRRRARRLPGFERFSRLACVVLIGAAGLLVLRAPSGHMGGWRGVFTAPVYDGALRLGRVFGL
jgi:hypothetical protein